MKITKQVAPAFEDFLFDWDYEQYLLIGGYGSGKSYQAKFQSLQSEIRILELKLFISIQAESLKECT